MGSAVSSLVSGFGKVVGEIFGAPLDFLSGKSCSSVCGSTWDLICYIENFCIINLLKMVAVLALLYVVLLFFYLLYKVGCCQCIGRGACKMLRECLASCCSSCEYGCMFLWFKLKNTKYSKEERLRRMDQYDTSSSDDDDDDLEDGLPYAHRRPRSIAFMRSLSQRSRERRRMHLERSLRPRSHRVHVGINRQSIYINDKDPIKHHRRGNMLHNIKVTHTSKFVQKANVKRINCQRRLLV
ncbi:hypothetical protein Cni_G12293 [Canna indica]|uniref:Uncharacterized protein n=1 Tax=Canna indica TaxID=4628 RepID=A0AAQ3K7K4_9LILI|nr:hypothetical protein Cni_G12293 [Canna indica]